MSPLLVRLAHFDMRSSIFLAALISTLALFLGCRSETPPGSRNARPTTNAEFTDVSPHKIAFVQANGIRINYTDWGGDGPPLVMIHGIGDNPHIFDDLALSLHRHFRLLAYARRGHGQSDSPTGPYDLTTLVEDLRQFMDGVGIQKASLAGWSMGGNEITMFGGLYPQRVNKLIYIDAGYDWTHPPFVKAFGEILTSEAPKPSDLQNLDAYRIWNRSLWFGDDLSWSNGLDSYLRDGIRTGQSGELTPIPNETAFQAAFQTLSSPPRDYLKVRAPALALYAPQFFAVDRANAERTQRVTEFETKIMQPFRKTSIERIQRELRGGVTVRVIEGVTHMSIGVREPVALADEIGKFLLGRTASTSAETRATPGRQ